MKRSLLITVLLAALCLCSSCKKEAKPINSIFCSIEQQNDLALEFVENENVFIFTASEDFQNFKWYLDDELVAENVSSYTVDAAVLADGVYSIYVEAEKDGMNYSSNASFVLCK